MLDVETYPLSESSSISISTHPSSWLVTIYVSSLLIVVHCLYFVPGPFLTFRAAIFIIALKSAYSYKAKENNIVVIDSLSIGTPKTKDMVKLLESLNLSNDKTLIIVKEFDENLLLAARNLKKVMIELPSEVSALDVVSAKKLLIEEGALEGIKEVLK